MPKIEEKIVITSSADLQHHFDSILPSLQLAETEDSWQKIEKSLIKLESITKSGGYKHDSFAILFKSVAQPIINSLLSERTKLSGTTADLLNSVAPRLGERFESLIHVFAPTLLLICARTNKVALVRAKKCLLLIAKHCKLPSLLTHLRDASKDKSQTMRVVSVEVTLMLLEAVDSKDKIGRRVTDVETIVQGTATDRDPEVRQWCKRVFEVYIDWWPERVTLFTSSFTPTTRRYLALPKASSSAPAKSVSPQKAHITPFKRSEPSQPHHAGTTHVPSLPTLKAAHTTSNPHPSTSHTTSSSSTSQLQHTNKVRQASKVQSNAPSSSASSSRSNQPVINIVEAKQPMQKATVESEDDKKRAALRAEILKQATGTPSQSIAARLALQQLDFQMLKSQKASAATEGVQHEIIQRQTDRALFNIAMAKKKQSPIKGPSRIVVAAPPSTSQKPLPSASKPPQRIVSSSSSRGKKANVEEEEPDVFRSRPIPTKMTSSISKGLSAREKLLKTSSSTLKATSSPLVNRGIKGARMTPRKKAALKVDIGKENIPPYSELASIAQCEPVETPRGRIAPSVLIASTVASVEASRLSRPVVQDELVEEEESANEAVVCDIAQGVSSNIKEETLPLIEINEEDIVASTSSALIEAEVVAHDIESPAIPPSSSERASPLNDWNEVATSLPSDEPQQEEETKRISIAIDNEELTFSPPSKVIIAPFMSTPARKTLGEIHHNIISPLSLSSPLYSKTRQKSSGTATRMAVAPPFPVVLQKTPIVSAQDENSHASKPKKLILAISRKM